MDNDRARYFRQPRRFELQLGELWTGQQQPIEEFDGKRMHLHGPLRIGFGKYALTFGDACMWGWLEFLLQTVETLEEQPRASCVFDEGEPWSSALRFARNDDVLTLTLEDSCNGLGGARPDWGTACCRWSDFRDQVLTFLASFDDMLRERVPDARIRWDHIASYGPGLRRMMRLFCDDIDLYDRLEVIDTRFDRMAQAAELVPQCVPELDAGRLVPTELRGAVEFVLAFRRQWLSTHFPGEEDEIDDMREATAVLRDLHRRLPPVEPTENVAKALSSLQTPQQRIVTLLQALEDADPAVRARRLEELERTTGTYFLSDALYRLDEDAAAFGAFVELVRRLDEIGLASLRPPWYQQQILDAVRWCTDWAPSDAEWLRIFARAHDGSA